MLRLPLQTDPTDSSGSFCSSNAYTDAETPLSEFDRQVIAKDAPLLTMEELVSNLPLSVVSVACDSGGRDAT